MKKEDGMKCACRHHSVIPFLMVLFALVFLLGAFDIVTARTVSITWPILIGVAGLMKMNERRCTCC